MTTQSPSACDPDIQFRKFIELASDAIAVLQDGQIGYVNDSLCRMRGLRRQQLVGSGVEKIIAPEEVERIRENYCRRMRGEPVPQTYESKGLGPRGEVRDIEISAAVVTFQSRPADLVIIRDITERLRNQQELAASENRYRALAEGTSDMIARWDRSMQVVYANRAVERFAGIPREEMIGRCIGQFAPDSRNADLLEGHIRECFLTGGEAVTEIPVERDGEVYFLDWRLIPERDATGQVQTVLTTARDITPRVLADQKVRQSRERLDLALEAANEGLWDWNVQTGEVYFSPRWYTMLGYEPHSLPPSYATWRELMHPDDLPVALDEQMAHFASASEGFGHEARMRAADGSWRWILSRGKTVERDEQGRCLRLVGTHVDITELKESQQKLQRLHDRLRKMSAQMALAEQQHRQRIAQDLHDHVGQNLAVVMILLQKLQPQIDTDQAEAIGQALDRIEQVSRTTRDLTSQLFPAVLRQLGLAAGVEWVAESVLKPHGIALQVGSDLPTGTWQAEVCSVLWRSVRELLVNVVKHAEARSVRIDMDRNGQKWILRICDDGLGLGGRDQQQLEDNGQGMGLFSVRQGLEHLGGRLEIRQAPEGGTEALIHLPPCGQQGTQ